MTVGSYSWYNRAVEHIKYPLVVLILVAEKTKYLLVVVIRRWRRKSTFGGWWRNLWLLLLGLLCEGSALNLPQGNYFLDLMLCNLWLLGGGT